MLKKLKLYAPRLQVLLDPSAVFLGVLTVGLSIAVGIGWALTVVGVLGFVASEVSA